MNDRKSSDKDHMNRVLIPMNVYVEHVLLNHVRWWNISHNHYICTNHFLRHRRLLLLHHHLLPLRSFPIVHSCPTRINSKHLEKINCCNIVHQRDISNAQLEWKAEMNRLAWSEEIIFPYLSYLHWFVLFDEVTSLLWANLERLTTWWKSLDWEDEV